MNEKKRAETEYAIHWFNYHVVHNLCAIVTTVLQRYCAYNNYEICVPHFNTIIIQFNHIFWQNSSKFLDRFRKFNLIC